MILLTFSALSDFDGEHLFFFGGGEIKRLDIVLDLHMVQAAPNRQGTVAIVLGTGVGTLRFWDLFWWSKEAVMLGGGVPYRTRCLILHKT